MTMTAGLDVGGTKTVAVVADATGSTVASVRRPTLAGGGDRVIRSVIEAIAEVAHEAGIAPQALGAVGIGIPGLADALTGDVRHAVNLGIGAQRAPIAARVAARYAVPVAVENDVKVAALGAATHFPDAEALAYLSVGTGIAAGLVLGGRLHRGLRGAAGEIGHLSVDPDGPLCECGQRGCLEVLASGSAISRSWSAGDGRSPSAALFAAAEADDPHATSVRTDLVHHLAGAVTALGLTVDPTVVVLGGGVAEMGAPLLDAVARALRSRAARSPLMADLGLADRLALLPPGMEAGAVGAVELARAEMRRGVAPR